MHLLFYLFIFLLSFIGMEMAARFTHKYIMHGFLWQLHKDHHISNGKLEHNDWFSIFFAIPSFLNIYFGLKYNHPLFTSIGAGMAAYGFVYFLIHDVFIHQRIKLFRNSENYYFKALRRAHKIHHKHTERENGESFGFLIVNKKYFREKNSSLFDKN
jgi:beta-carotene 3-hydroxylase